MSDLVKIYPYKSIGYYNDWLPEHADHHAINLDSVSGITLTTGITQKGIRFSVHAKDGRGKEYHINIQQT